MNTGLGVEGSINLRFCAEDCSTDVNEEFLGLKKALEMGIGI